MHTLSILYIKYIFDSKCWKNERSKEKILMVQFCVEINKNERLNQSRCFFVFTLNLIISFVRLSILNLQAGKEYNIYNITAKFNVINFVLTPCWANVLVRQYSARSTLLSVCLNMEIPWNLHFDLWFNVHLLILNPWASNSTLNLGTKHYSNFRIYVRIYKCITGVVFCFFYRWCIWNYYFPVDIFILNKFHIYAFNYF